MVVFSVPIKNVKLKVISKDNKVYENYRQRRPKLKDCKIQDGVEPATFPQTSPKKKRNFINTPKKVVKKRVF